MPMCLQPHIWQCTLLEGDVTLFYHSVLTAYYTTATIFTPPPPLSQHFC